MISTLLRRVNEGLSSTVKPGFLLIFLNRTFQIKKIEANIKSQPAGDIVLLDNHLLITENFVCFGSVVEGIFLL